MWRFTTIGLLFSVACGESSTAGPDAGAFLDAATRPDAVVADAGPPDKGQRRLGIDVSTATGESFAQAFDVASESGMDFITLPLNWSDIEPGPDDDFRFTSLDTKKWRRTAVSGTLDHDAGVLRWTEGTAATDDAWIYASYRATSADMSFAADLSLDSAGVAGTEVTLLARFAAGAGDTAGNRCAGTDDDYVAVVFIGGTGQSLAMATCTDGVFATGAVVSAPEPSMRVRIRRAGDQVIAEYRTAAQPAYTQLGAVSAAPFAAEVRPYLYFGNPDAGTTVVSVDNVRVEGTVAWDVPTDRFTSDPGFDILGVVELVYGALPVSVGLSLRTINTVSVEIPSDLRAVDASTGLVDFSRAEVRTRFKQFVDHVYSRIPSVKLRSVSVGNEVDGYLGSTATAWSQYKAFVDDVAPHARDAWTHGTIVAGVKGTFEGLVRHSNELMLLNANTDVVMLTYYPLQSDFTVQEPSVVAGDFDTMVTTLDNHGLGAKPIYLLEVGYPSAPPSSECTACNSSEAKQATFVANVFNAWDTHAARIHSVNFNWLTDVSRATVDQWRVYYGVDVPAFLEFLRTLGLRTETGVAKQAWGTLKAEAHARGWLAR